jgi:hypothetical protein
MVRLDHASLMVRVMGIPAGVDPIQLNGSVSEQAYEHQEAHDILQFQWPVERR